MLIIGIDNQGLISFYVLWRKKLIGVIFFTREKNIQNKLKSKFQLLANFFYREKKQKRDAPQGFQFSSTKATHY